MKKTQKVIEHCLHGDLQNLVHEFELGQLTTESIYGYFSQMLRHAEVDSQIVVNVLEQFGEEGIYAATCIKVNEGW
jgi:hypothetical protein